MGNSHVITQGYRGVELGIFVALRHASGWECTWERGPVLVLGGNAQSGRSQYHLAARKRNELLKVTTWKRYRSFRAQANVFPGPWK